MSAPTPYDEAYYRDMQASARRAARIVAPLVARLVEPRSVLDVGCGLGTWLAAFVDLGVEDVYGIDGHDVTVGGLEISADRFEARDLKEPFRLSRTFDLALCLAVAEHLPVDAGAHLVESLTRSAPVLLFSAAIPGQGGTHHVNEQWPDYWAEMFVARGFVPVDCIRRRIWSNEAVEWWYAQNLLVFCEHDELRRRPALWREYDFAGVDQLSLVHPRKYSWLLEWAREQQ